MRIYWKKMKLTSLEKSFDLIWHRSKNLGRINQNPLKLLTKRNLLFKKTLCTVRINRMAGGVTTRGNQVIETNKITKFVSKIIAEWNFNMEVQQHKVRNYLVNIKGVPFTNNSKLLLLAITLIHSVVKKLFIKEITKSLLAWTLCQFIKQ